MLNYYFNNYTTIFFFIIFSFILGCLILVFSFFCYTYSPTLNKYSIYECGFDPYDDARQKFDVRFYIIAILFLIFDLEVLFLIPWCISISFLTENAFWGLFDFIIEIVVGLFYAWVVGALDWI